MKAIWPIAFLILTGLLVAAGTLNHGTGINTSSPEGTVQAMFADVRDHDLRAAYAFVLPASNVKFDDFRHDVLGRDGSLLTFSKLENASTRTLHETDNDALVRTELKYATAVGTFYDTRDLKVVKDEGAWKVDWPLEKAQTVPPQVIPVNYLRWDVIWRNSEDDWGAQNVEGPRIRVLSMNPAEREGGVIIMGEVENEDTVPAFVSVGAVLVGKNGQDIAEESSFDKTSHVLLPKEISPYRIDYPGMKLADVKSVRMKPDSMLVPAAADPVIGVMHQKIDKDAKGRTVLKGDLLNESGTIVNIPHVLATFYDDNGRVIWVSDGYLDHALLPQTPQPFAVELMDDIAPKVHSYRVTVNQYSLNGQS